MTRFKISMDTINFYWLPKITRSGNEKYGTWRLSWLWFFLNVWWTE